MIIRGNERASVRKLLNLKEWLTSWSSSTQRIVSWKNHENHRPCFMICGNSCLVYTLHPCRFLKVLLHKSREVLLFRTKFNEKLTRIFLCVLAISVLVYIRQCSPLKEDGSRLKKPTYLFSIQEKSLFLVKKTNKTSVDKTVILSPQLISDKTLSWEARLGSFLWWFFIAVEFLLRILREYSSVEEKKISFIAAFFCVEITNPLFMAFPWR